jgi:catechol 2,3-dioxygenase-like lactoylglutathione lyase family enzyme
MGTVSCCFAGCCRIFYYTPAGKNPVSEYFFGGQMISGTHVIVYSKNAEADRAFFRDVLGFKSVDAGHGWLIFAMPPGEAAFHPSNENGPHELFFMCDVLKTEMAALAKNGVKFSEVHEERWGSITKIRLPGGGEIGLYQPKHPTALSLGLKMRRSSN